MPGVDRTGYGGLRIAPVEAMAGSARRGVRRVVALETILDGGPGILFDPRRHWPLRRPSSASSRPLDPLVGGTGAPLDVSVFHANWKALLDELGPGDLRP